MAENVLYADLNLLELTRPRIQTVPDVQDSGCTYAEVKVKCQDTNAAANCKSSGKSCCSRKRVAVLVVIILVLVLAVYLIITYGPASGTQQDSRSFTSTSQNVSTPLSPTSQQDSTTLTSTSQNVSTPLSPTSQQESTTLTSTTRNVSTPFSPITQEDSTKSPPSHEAAPGVSFTHNHNMSTTYLAS